MKIFCVTLWLIILFVVNVLCSRCKWFGAVHSHTTSAPSNIISILTILCMMFSCRKLYLLPCQYWGLRYSRQSGDSVRANQKTPMQKGDCERANPRTPLQSGDCQRTNQRTGLTASNKSECWWRTISQNADKRQSVREPHVRRQWIIQIRGFFNLLSKFLNIHFYMFT